MQFLPTYHRNIYYKVAAFILLLGAIGVLYMDSFSMQTFSFTGSRSLDAYANEILTKCKDADDRPECYDEQIPELMSELSMEETFSVTKRIQEEDNSYWYCHVLGHEISAKETRKDPSNWKEVVSRCPSNLCSNGCIHGAFQERFSANALPDSSIEELTPILSDVCKKRNNWNPTGVEKATCYHALGHLTMYVTDGNVDKSLRLCDATTEKDSADRFAQLCYDGVYMQVFQPLGAEDKALVKDIEPETQAEARQFCNRFSGKRRSSCHTESWPLFREQLLQPNGIVSFCSVFNGQPKEKERCYNAGFYVITAQVRFDEERVVDICGNTDNTHVRDRCFANAASRMIETDARLIDKAIRICRKAEEFGSGDECYDELAFFSSYMFRRGSEPFERLCSNMPQEWRSTCRNQGAQ